MKKSIFFQVFFVSSVRWFFHRRKLKSFLHATKPSHLIMFFLIREMPFVGMIKLMM